MKDNLVQHIGSQLVALARQAQEAMKSEVDDIIQSGSQDTARIEHMLDHLLSFCYDAAVLLTFKRLCRHYFSFAPVATAEYIQAYRELWDTPDDEEVGGAGV